jgi:hypothetical protein
LVVFIACPRRTTPVINGIIRRNRAGFTTKMPAPREIAVKYTKAATTRWIEGRELIGGSQPHK